MMMMMGGRGRGGRPAEEGVRVEVAHQRVDDLGSRARYPWGGRLGGGGGGVG